MSIRWRLIFLSTVSVFIMFGFTVAMKQRNDTTLNHLKTTRIKVEALQSSILFQVMPIDGWFCLMTSWERSAAFKVAIRTDRLTQYEIRLQQFDTNWSVGSQLVELKKVLMSLARATESTDNTQLTERAFDLLKSRVDGAVWNINDLADQDIGQAEAMFVHLTNYVFWTQREAWLSYSLYRSRIEKPISTELCVGALERQQIRVIRHVFPFGHSLFKYCDNC